LVDKTNFGRQDKFFVYKTNFANILKKIFARNIKVMENKIILFFFLFSLFCACLYSFYTKKYFLIGVVFGGWILYFLLFYFLFGWDEVKENFFTFRFLHDAANIAANPEVYCGDDLLLPDEYDVMGSRFQCLRKGIGTGMMLPDAHRVAFLARPRVPSPVRTYCGNAPVLPPAYTRFGTNSECLKKGIGVGLAMDPARRAVAQARPLRVPGKKEIMSMAQRLRITTHDKTRQQTLQAIADQFEDFV
jgi:hypothetical protein